MRSESERRDHSLEIGEFEFWFLLEFGHHNHDLLLVDASDFKGTTSLAALENGEGWYTEMNGY